MNNKILAWILVIWSAIRIAYFLTASEVITAFGEGAVWFYIIYFGLVIWLCIRIINSEN